MKKTISSRTEKVCVSELSEDHADIVLAYPDQASESDKKLARELLDESESQRATRFRFERDRELFRLSHAFLRITLARYLDAEPRSLGFVTLAGGRPELDVLGDPPVRFNLSHTTGLIACVVTRRSECGVDAEVIRRLDDNFHGAVLTEAELSELGALGEESRMDRFCEFWTLKEAYVKGRGLGLHIPLQHLDFSDFNKARRLKNAPGANHDTRAWRFWSARPTPQHRVAAAMRVTTGKATFRLIETCGLF